MALLGYILVLDDWLPLLAVGDILQDILRVKLVETVLRIRHETNAAADDGDSRDDTELLPCSPEMWHEQHCEEHRADNVDRHCRLPPVFALAPGRRRHSSILNDGVDSIQVLLYPSSKGLDAVELGEVEVPNLELGGLASRCHFGLDGTGRIGACLGISDCHNDTLCSETDEAFGAFVAKAGVGAGNDVGAIADGVLVEGDGEVGVLVSEYREEAHGC